MSARAACVVLAACLAAACTLDLGTRPEEVQAVVERAAAAWDAQDLDAVIDEYTGRQAGRFRQDLATLHDGDLASFFASKRRMVVVGPVNIRRRAFATVRVLVVRVSGFKPYGKVSVVFRDDVWRIDSFLPGDVERAPVDKANPLGIIGLLRDAAELTGTPANAGVFGRIQTIRAIEVASARRIAGAVEPLMLLLENKTDAGVRQFSAYALGQLGDPQAAPALRVALTDDDLRVRADAALSLAAMGIVDAAAEIGVLAADDPSPWVREKAREALETLGVVG